MEPWVLAHGLKALRECLKLVLDTDPLVVVPACPKVPAVPAETAEPRERMLEERREGMWTGTGVRLYPNGKRQSNYMVLLTTWKSAPGISTVCVSANRSYRATVRHEDENRRDRAPAVREERL
jgi:hypothetical protein